jgi:hypothetical protein
MAMTQIADIAKMMTVDDLEGLPPITLATG